MEELIREVTVCAVYLHPVESGTVYSVARRFCVRNDVILDLGLGQRTGWLRPAGQRDGRCGDVRRRRILLLEEIYVGDTTKRPELEEDVRPFSMDGIRDLMQSQTVRQVQDDRQRRAYLFPALDLCVSVDAWDMSVSSCVMGDDSGFCDEQRPWCGTALRIVGCLLWPGDMGGMRSETGQGGKDDTVLER